MYKPKWITYLLIPNVVQIGETCWWDGTIDGPMNSKFDTIISWTCPFPLEGCGGGAREKDEHICHPKAQHCRRQKDFLCLWGWHWTAVNSVSFVISVYSIFRCNSFDVFPAALWWNHLNVGIVDPAPITHLIWKPFACSFLSLVSSQDFPSPLVLSQLPIVSWGASSNDIQSFCF